MRRLLPALLLFVWSSVPYDCKGGPERIAGYLASDAEIVIARWEIYTVEGIDCSSPVYAFTSWTPRASLVTESFDWPAPEVGLGEVALLNVEEVDEAGNVSGGDCP